MEWANGQSSPRWHMRFCIVVGRQRQGKPQTVSHKHTQHLIIAGAQPVQQGCNGMSAGRANSGRQILFIKPCPLWGPIPRRTALDCGQQTERYLEWWRRRAFSPMCPYGHVRQSWLELRGAKGTRRVHQGA